MKNAYLTKEEKLEVIQHTIKEVKRHRDFESEAFSCGIISGYLRDNYRGRVCTVKGLVYMKFIDPNIYREWGNREWDDIHTGIMVTYLIPEIQVMEKMEGASWIKIKDGGAVFGGGEWDKRIKGLNLVLEEIKKGGNDNE